MGALFFFLLFLCLIPVSAAVMNLLSGFGLLGDLEDPAEWDAAEEQPEVEQRAVITLVEGSGKQKAV